MTVKTPAKGSGPEPGPPWRVVIFDDQTTGMELFHPVLARHKDFKVLGSLKSGDNAVVQINHFKPHLVLMDLQARRLQVMEIIEQITSSGPVPILLIVPPKNLEADRVIQAMELGPVVCFERPATLKAFQEKTEDLLALCAQAAASPVGQSDAPPPPPKDAPPPAPAQKDRELQGGLPVVALGLSTGGPGVLMEFLTTLKPPVGCGLVVAQHMLGGFMEALASRLRDKVSFHVELVDTLIPVKAGTVYLPQDGYHLEMLGTAQKPEVQPVPFGLRPSPACPSADVLFKSMAAVMGKQSFAMVFTGMGRDGLEGARAVRDAGGKVWVQSADTCVVNGMPKAVADAGLAHQVLPVREMALQLGRLAGTSAG